MSMEPYQVSPCDDVEQLQRALADAQEQWRKTNAEYERVSKALATVQRERDQAKLLVYRLGKDPSAPMVVADLVQVIERLDKELIEAGISYDRGYKQGLEDGHRCEQRHARLDQLEKDNATLTAGLTALKESLNVPEIIDFVKAVNLEAAHQRERWGTDHDGGKTDADWFWLIGYLNGKGSASAGEAPTSSHYGRSSIGQLASLYAWENQHAARN